MQEPIKQDSEKDYKKDIAVEEEKPSPIAFDTSLTLSQNLALLKQTQGISLPLLKTFLNASAGTLLKRLCTEQKKGR